MQQTGALTESLGFLTMSINVKLRRHFNDSVMKAYDLEHRQAGILWICLNAPSTQNHLASFGDLDKNYARIFVDDLEAKGLVTRVINPTNRREKLVTLTKKGEKVAKECLKLMQESQNAVLSPYLNQEEIQTLHSILLKFFLTMRQSEFYTKEKK